MTPGGLTDSSAPPSESSPEVGEELLEVVSSGSGTSAGGVDIETRHRLRRALRILLAARRRDDGSFQHSDS